VRSRHPAGVDPEALPRAAGGDDVVGGPLYEIRVRGTLGPTTAAALAPLHPVTETVLRGPVADQEALHGFLERIRDLGLELVDVRRVGETPAD
jgi:hypothetical protein